MLAKRMTHFEMHPLVALLMAWGVSITDVSDIVKLLASGAALGYTIWKWMRDAKK